MCDHIVNLKCFALEQAANTSNRIWVIGKTTIDRATVAAFPFNGLVQSVALGLDDMEQL